ncbi:MAG: MFS transporter [Candidatus Anstonellaceae archaeon]
MKVNKNIITSLSIKDGIFWSIMLGTGEAYVTPFAIAIQAPTYFIGLLSSLPMLIGSLFQAFSLHLFNILSNRKIIILGSVMLQALIWLLFSLYISNQSFSLNTILLLFIFYFIFAMLPAPLWNSWIADLIPKRDLGHFFARRNQYLLFFQFISILTAGYILNSLFKEHILVGFSFLFFIAFVSRSFCIYFLYKTPDKSSFFIPSSTQQLNWKKFLFNKKFYHYRNFSLFTFILILGTYIASPFFDVYMLKVLKFDYFSWSVILFASGLSKIFFFKYWADSIKFFGHKAVLVSTTIIISLIPILWIFVKEPFFIFLINMLTGIAWSGFDMVTFLYLLWPKEKEVKILYTSFIQLVRGASTVIGSLIGGILLTFFEQNFDKFFSFYLIFILSSLLRTLSIFLFHKKLDTHPISEYKFFLKELFFSYPTRWFAKNKDNFIDPVLHFTKFFKQKNSAFSSLLAKV